MKSPIYKVLLILLTFTVSEVSSQKAVDHIFDQLKNTKNYSGGSIPGWLIKLGLWVMPNQNEDELNALLNLGRKIKKIRVGNTSLDPTKHNTKALVNNFVNNMASEDGFAEYLSVKQEDSHLKIMIQEYDETIHNVVILNEDKGDISVVHLKTNLSYQDIRNISFNDLRNDVIQTNVSP